MRATHLIASSFILVAGASASAWSQTPNNQQVNPQVTDSVTQPNVEVLGDAPADAMGNLYQETDQALANAAHNATSAQQNANTVLQATTTQGVEMLEVEGDAPAEPD
ncbi:RebB family R body protein [Maricaulis sp.]|uniref:RebB family R body protein n=1 Tax=Maricaulis sp. TaxID=1486257 RepID=UPI003A92DCF7